MEGAIAVSEGEVLDTSFPSLSPYGKHYYKYTANAVPRDETCVHAVSRRLTHHYTYSIKYIMKP